MNNDAHEITPKKRTLPDEAYHILGEKDALVLSASIYMRKRLLRWIIRTSIGAILFGYIAFHYSWGKYILYFWIPLSILSLLVIVFGSTYIQRKGQGIELRVQSIRDETGE